MVKYTDAQLEAIRTIDRNLQVVACAGSGKTDVVAERVAEILDRGRSRQVHPKNIVAFTFTERAAGELKARIVQRVQERLGPIPGLAELYVGTIHGYCLQLLQTYLPRYFKYGVLNEIQTRLLVDRASQKTGLQNLGLRRWVDSELYLDVLNVLREADIDWSALRQHPALDSLQMYRRYLDEKRYLDYTEIVFRAVEELRVNEDLRARFASQVKYLIVDEYQDVNPLQEQLISELHALGANICVVGDDDQTIYQWRGSTVDGILGFDRRYPNVHTVPIELNFRSSVGVVESARRVIEANNPFRLEKAMQSAGTQPFERGDILCLRFDSPEEEARWIARKAKQMIGLPFVDRPGEEPRGLAQSDIAILLRSVRRNGAPIVAALREEGLEVVVAGMTGLLDRPEVQAAVGIFQFMDRRISREDLRDLWVSADLGIAPTDLEAAIAKLAADREWDRNVRFSVYSLQRTYLNFLEAVSLREERVPNDRGEVVYYNLGKFSEVISDYEQIHFHSEPQQKYRGFVEFLERQAPHYYPEGWQDGGYARPNAVHVMTVHQAKGMQWPVVFVPCLTRNRFPSKKQGGRGIWHVIPRAAVRNADGYDGSIEDERRLFYVALTRSKKYLCCTWAPDSTNRLYKLPSQFVAELTASEYVLTKEPRRPEPARLGSTPRRGVANVAFSFSELKYLLECPYQFKLRFMYGFNPPIHEALGYGKSLHDALSELHKRALRGDRFGPEVAEELLDRHLHLPFVYPELRESLRASGIAALRRYIQASAAMLDRVEHVEQVVEVNLGDGLVVNGRIDLIRRTDTREIVIVDFKSTERAQAEDVTRMQLHVYALGYKELAGASADLIEIYNLDHGGSQREEIDSGLETRTADAIRAAGVAVRENALHRKPKWAPACETCDLVGICRSDRGQA